MVVQSGGDKAVKSMLNQLFVRYRQGLWNSYDTTIAIAYLIQSKFQHIDLLGILREKCPDLYHYYYYGCKTSFLCQLSNTKLNQVLRCVEKDRKTVFLYFMSVCEKNRYNYLVSYAYYKNFFDRITAHMTYLAGEKENSKKPNFRKYYKESEIKRVYSNIPNSEAIITQAHKMRNENPLSHASARLIDSDNTSADLQSVQDNLYFLICEYAQENCL